MSSANLQATIAADILPHLEGETVHEKWLNCARDYPWYPIPFLMLAKEQETGMVQKANLWFSEPNRLHWIINSADPAADPWLTEQIELQRSNNTQQAEEEYDRAVDESDTDNNITVEDELSETEISVEPGIYASDVSLIEKESDGIDPQQDNAVNNNPVFNGEPASSQLNNLVTNNESVPVDISDDAAEVNLPASVQKEPLLFEPYHSVDYFASMGIKVDLSEVPKDTFDRQLKSFTQWLKTMKKVTIPEAAAADPLVEAQANQSNVNKEIITEAMAQVLVKQGKHEKAAEIYQKLLLLHPEKSVFFAAQIEQLKKHPMTILFLILIILASAILGFIILVQNPKGGGLASNVGSFGNQLMGVKQTTDVLEKGTWLFASIIGILCLTSTLFMGGGVTTKDSLLDKVNTSGAAAPAQQTPPTTAPAQQTNPDSGK